MESLMNPQFSVERTVYTNKNIVRFFFDPIVHGLHVLPMILRISTEKCHVQDEEQTSDLPLSYFKTSLRVKFFYEFD